MSYRERYEDVLKLTIEVTGCEVIDGQVAVDQNTLHHQIATGAMVAEVLDSHGFDEAVQRVGAFSGAVHDAGKFHPTISELMRVAEGRVFTDEERYVMQSHTLRGHFSIVGLNRPKFAQEIEAAAFVALRHHDRFTPERYREYGHMAGLTHIVQLCDVGHARLLDRSRTYSKARDGGELGKETIAAQIVQDFENFPPMLLGKTINVEASVRRWYDEAA